MGIFGPISGDLVASSLNLSGAYVDLPASGLEGRQYLTEDSVHTQLRDTGSAWEHFRDGQLLTLPLDSGYSWVNQGTASLIASGGTLTLRALNNQGTHDYKLRVKTAPGTPWTLDVACYFNGSTEQNEFGGVLVRESSTGKLILFAVGCVAGSNLGVRVQNMDSPTVRAFPTSAATFWQNISSVCWFRVNDDGVNLTWSYSLDGVDYTQFFQASRTAFLAGGANQIGFFVQGANSIRGSASDGLRDCFFTVIHWLES